MLTKQIVNIYVLIRIFTSIFCVFYQKPNLFPR